MKYLFILLLCAGVTTSYGQLFSKAKSPKVPVEGVQGVLTGIPDSVTILRSDGAMFFFLYDFDKKTLFITEKEKLYQLFATHQKASNANRVVIDGTLIDPFTIFKKRELQKKAKKAGVQLNGFKVCKLMNYELQ